MLLKLDALGSPTLEIRRANEDDTDFFYKWWNTGELMKNVGFDDGLNISRENVIKSISSGNLFIVLYDNFPIGEVNYKVRGIYEFGIKLIPDFQNKGLGKKVLTLFFDYLYYIGAKDLTADVLVSNKRAIKLYSSIGFKVIEEKKGGWIDPDGTARDYLIMVKKYEY